MRKILTITAAAMLIGSCSGHKQQFGAVQVGPANPGQLLYLTWGVSTADAGYPCVLLDGGAATFYGDPFALGGVAGNSAAAASVFCNVPSGGSQAGTFNIQLSNDEYGWVNVSSTGAIIDGGVGDGGTPGAILLTKNAAPYARVALTTFAAQNFDGGFFCDAGAQGPSIIGECDAGCGATGCMASYIDSGVNFCDGGNFCDAGPSNYQISPAVELVCNAVTMPN